MKSLKKVLATITLTGIIIIGVTNANAGIMMSDLNRGDNQPEPCTQRSEQVDRGIIFELTGIIFELVGLDAKDKKDDTTRIDCGIIFE